MTGETSSKTETAAFTKGPWSFIDAEDGNAPESGPLTICGGNLDDLASIYSRDDATVSTPFQEAVANARLIAAAPTMADYIKKQADAGCSEAASIWRQINAGA